MISTPPSLLASIPILFEACVAETITSEFSRTYFDASVGHVAAQ